MPARVCIVGAGVIGTSVAYCLLQSVPDADVTLVSERFTPDTTSDVAAGLWMPHRLGNTSQELIRRWGEKTRDFILSLILSGEKDSGVQIISGYMLDNQNPYSSSASSFLSYAPMTEHESRLFPHRHAQRHSLTTVMCEGRKYVAWMLHKIRDKGAKIVHRKIGALRELYNDFDIIVNCSGPGALTLTGDKEAFVERGQAIKVRAPWIKHFYSVDDWNYYIIPGTDDVTLGSTHQRDDYSLEPRDSDAKAIWEGCCDIVPSLRNAEIVRHTVGLRPCRTSVRLEEEMVPYNGKNIKLIHNYGHGGGGLTLHYGCALDVVSSILSWSPIDTFKSNKSKL